MLERNQIRVKLVNEAYTSQRCSNCQKLLEKFCSKESGGLLHELLRCYKSNTRSGCGVIFNRDFNGSKNILHVAESIKDGPLYLRRPIATSSDRVTEIAISVTRKNSGPEKAIHLKS